jgi:hypothetical protein
MALLLGRMLAVAIVTLVVTAVATVGGLVLLGLTLGQAKSIKRDLQRCAEFKVHTELIQPPGAVRTRETRNGVTGDLFTIDVPHDTVQIALRAQLRNTGERAAQHVLWNVVGPTGVDLRFYDGSGKVEYAR